MLNKSEKKKLQAKTMEWDLALRGFEKWLDNLKILMKRTNKTIKHNTFDALDWYFGDSGVYWLKKWLRRFGIIMVDVIILRLLRII